MAMVGKTANRLLATNATVATCQGGQLPFYLEGRRIIDLCGLMNNYIAHSGKGGNPTYLESEHIDHFILYYSEDPDYHIPLTLFPGMISTEYFRSHYYLDRVFCHTSRFSGSGLKSTKYMLLFSRRGQPLETPVDFGNLKMDIYETIQAGRGIQFLCNLSGLDRGEYVVASDCPCKSEELVVQLGPDSNPAERNAPVVQSPTQFPVRLTKDRPRVDLQFELEPDSAYTGWTNVVAHSGQEWIKVRLSSEIVSQSGTVKSRALHESYARGWAAIHMELDTSTASKGDRLRMVVDTDGPLDGSLEIYNLMAFRVVEDSEERSGAERRQR